MENIREIFDSIIQLTDEEFSYYLSKLSYKEYKKGEIITKKGSIENYAYYVQKGIVRRFIDKGEGDLTFYFSFEHDFVCAYDSFITQTPCRYMLQALENTSVMRMSWQDVQDLYRQSLKWERIGRILNEKAYLERAEREFSLLAQSPQERYESLFQQNREVIKRVPLKYIASYIGITPQALSRIRKRIF
ncbi:cyclic nucleotide-binding domain-containing protein [Elizabethkingia argentiflava]|uniref:Cyclic nucleotide-binding domain-containing protein n=1 Tax=Elizabethkingia argenteiflava TaxID=2681556 RepID=A0A845PYC0_9FLAO|nr:Crp/Fnr family transcriptional regulator [Elizabethkingia argenteiflava]NAW51911.1 cyclic nucleotide-binding domain-containing protein [Elizabethkingia argenteiflava]